MLKDPLARRTSSRGFNTGDPSVTQSNDTIRLFFLPGEKYCTSIS